MAAASYATGRTQMRRRPPSAVRGDTKVVRELYNLKPWHSMSEHLVDEAMATPR